MTETEAKDFRRVLINHFPGLQSWFEGLPEPAETWRVWRGCLQPYSLAECVSVVSRWSDGTLKPFEAYERERVHLFIRAIVERDRSLAASKAEHGRLSTPQRASGLAACSPVLARCVEMAKNGYDEELIQAYIDEQCPTSPAYSQPRHKCHACLDRGYVLIWSPADVVRYVQKHKPEPTCECVIDCPCNSASQRIKYDPSKHCRKDITHSRKQAIQALDAWLAERDKIENHGNYNSAFAEFT